MRDAMFFPNRILYRAELLSTTVTYAVELSEAEFWNLKPVTPIEQLGIRPAEFRLNGNSRFWKPNALALGGKTALLERTKAFIFSLTIAFFCDTMNISCWQTCIALPLGNVSASHYTGDKRTIHDRP